MGKSKITFDEFLEIENKLEIKVGKVIEAIQVPKKDKLLQLTVDFGNEDIRTVVTNLGEHFPASDFLDVKFSFITNLEPAKIGGIMSEAMIMPYSYEDGSVELIDPTVGGKLM